MSFGGCFRFQFVAKIFGSVFDFYVDFTPPSPFQAWARQSLEGPTAHRHSQMSQTSQADDLLSAFAGRWGGRLEPLVTELSCAAAE